MPNTVSLDSVSLGLESVYLNLGTWQERSAVNGPGERFVLWVQGCPLRCPGCINPEFLPFTEGIRISVAQMVEKILAVPNIEGVTYSGGEPTAQAKALALLSEQLRKAGLSVVCYSGFTLEQLKARRNPWIKRLLNSIDILIDGPYIRDQAANLLWRGSRNQQIHFLTERYRHLAEVVQEAPAEVEFCIGNEGFVASGNLPKELIRRLQEALRR
ncbi:MAG: radical SAM protein [Armatimonadetes bacterium]|nr:radical SAM protein [Armatimonadota bacterium]